jgi:hypothetical protein
MALLGQEGAQKDYYYYYYYYYVDIKHHNSNGCNPNNSSAAGINSDLVSSDDTLSSAGPSSSSYHSSISSYPLLGCSWDDAPATSNPTSHPLLGCDDTTPSSNPTSYPLLGSNDTIPSSSPTSHPLTWAGSSYLSWFDTTAANSTRTSHPIEIDSDTTAASSSLASHLWGWTAGAIVTLAKETLVGFAAAQDNGLSSHPLTDYDDAVTDTVPVSGGTAAPGSSDVADGSEANSLVIAKVAAQAPGLAHCRHYGVIRRVRWLLRL